MWTLDKFKEQETLELRDKVIEKLCQDSGKSWGDVEELALQLGLFVLIIMQGSNSAAIVSDTSTETIENPLK